MTETRYLAAFDFDKTLVYGPPSIGAFFHQWKMPEDVNISGEQKIRGAGPLGILGLALSQIPNLPFFRRLTNDAKNALNILDQREEETKIPISRMIISGRRIGTHWAVRWTARAIPKFELKLNPGISSHIYKKRRLSHEMRIRKKTVAAFFNDDWRALFHIGDLNNGQLGEDSIVYGYVLAGITNAFLSREIREELERRNIKIVKNLAEAVDDFTNKIQ